MLRNGEQLLLAVVIPVIVLVGGVDGAEHSTWSSRTRPVDAFTPGRPGAGGDVDGLHVAGDRDRVRATLRRDQAARLLAAAALRAPARQGRRAAGGRGLPGRRHLAVALALGWQPLASFAAAVLTVVARHGCLRGARALRGRGAAGGGHARGGQSRLPAAAGRRGRRAPGVGVRRLRRRRRAAALRALGEAMRAALWSGDWAWASLLVLGAWAVVGAALTARTFKWE